MTTWDLIVEKAKDLRPEQQSEVLDFIEHLQERPQQLRNPAGLLEDLKVDVSDEDLAQARRELWGGFPRDL